MEINQSTYTIFRNSSTTFYTSSLFFPKTVRNKVACLYAFVRLADNCIDTIPQDKAGFYQYWEEFKQARKGKYVQNHIINSFVSLEKSNVFNPKWMDAFLQSMEQDLTKQSYRTIAETEQYMYGSAGIIGLCLSAILQLPPASYPYAEMLGKSFQFINFIRDIAEDLEFKRVYFPQEDFERFSLISLDRQNVEKQQKEFIQFIHFQLERYRTWQENAEQGFSYIPKQYLVPIKTASDLYKWTASVIENNPFVVFKRKVKPNRVKILATAANNLLFI